MGAKEKARIGKLCFTITNTHKKLSSPENKRMIIRIVKLTFQAEKAADFIQIFETKKPTILQFGGCHHLELWRDKKAKNVFFTCSHWENEDCLNAYRHSEFFKETWAKTKAAFSDKPEAWSVEALD